jgi:DnaK suppressor protein
MDAAKARNLLDAERRRIEHALAAIEQSEAGGDPGDPHIEQHIADQGSDLYDREVDEGHVVELREQLAAVERAEQRLAAGTYGLSIQSGEPIPDARLEAVPTAERTVAEQAEWERGR